MTARAGPRRQAPPNPGGDHGLITLEWLLIVAAVAGLAASTALTVERVVDDTAEAPIEPGVRFLDAEIAAAAIASEATAWRQGLLPGTTQFIFFNPVGAYATEGFVQRCQAGLPAAFDDVVASAAWRRPQEYDEDPNFNQLLPTSPKYIAWVAGEIEAVARCEVTAHGGLGG